MEIFGGGDVTRVGTMNELRLFNDCFLTNQNGGFFSLFRKKYKRFLFYNFEILEGELFLLCNKVLESVTLNSRAEEISLPLLEIQKRENY